MTTKLISARSIYNFLLFEDGLYYHVLINEGVIMYWVGTHHSANNAVDEAGSPFVEHYQIRTPDPPAIAAAQIKTGFLSYLMELAL